MKGKQNVMGRMVLLVLFLSLFSISVVANSKIYLDQEYVLFQDDPTINSSIIDGDLVTDEEVYYYDSDDKKVKVKDKKEKDKDGKDKKVKLKQSFNSKDNRLYVGPTTDVYVLQDIVVLNTGHSEVKASLFYANSTVVEGEYWIINESNKFGANDTNNPGILLDYYYEMKSELPIIKDGYNYYFKEGAIGHEISFEDICGLLNESDQTYADCTYETSSAFDENTNITNNILTVNFKSYEIIDPSFSQKILDTNSVFSGTRFESANYTHIITNHPDLMFYTPFDADDDNSAHDYSPNNFDGSIILSPTYNSSGGFYGGAYEFDHTTSQRISFGAVMPKDSDALTNFTVSFWAKMNANDPSTNQVFVSDYNPSSGIQGEKGSFILAETGGPGTLRFDVWHNDTAFPYRLDSNTTLPVGSWVHITAVSNDNGTNLELFFNGTSVGTGGSPAASGDTSAPLFTVGGYTSRVLNGTVDEVMVFNRSLDDSEVNSIYNATISRFPTSGTVTNKFIKLTGVNESGEMIVQAEYERIEGSNISVRLGQWEVGDGYNNSGTNLVAYYHADGNAVDSAEGNNGTFNGNATADGVGTFDQAFSFDGDGDYVTTPFTQSFNFSNEDFSYGAWINSTRVNGSAQFLFGRGTPAANSPYFAWLSDDEIRFLVGNSTCDGWLTSEDLTYQFTANETFHAFFTKEGSDVKLYADGVEVDNFTMSSDTICQDSSNFSIGSSYTGTSPLNGTIDELMVFNKSLSADEVKEIYVEGRANWSYSAYQSLTAIDINDNSSSNAFPITVTSTLFLSDYQLLSDNDEFYGPVLKTSQEFMFEGGTTECGEINVPGQTYTLLNNLTSNNTCITITVSDVILNLNGYTITYGEAGIGNGVDVNGVSTLDNVTIINGSIIKGAGLGGTNYGIQFTSVENSLINDVSIHTAGDGLANYGIFINGVSNENTISDSTIIANGTGGNARGIRFDSASVNNSVVRNTITTDSIGISSFAIDSVLVDDSIFANNTIHTQSGSSSHGIRIAGGDNLTILNNTITSTGSLGRGINAGSLTNSNITDNYILTSGSGAEGIYFAGTATGTVVNNNNVTVGSTSAVRIDGSSGITFTSNDIDGALRGFFVRLFASDTTITNNNIVTTASNTRGIQIDTAVRTNVSSNVITLAPTSGTPVGIFLIRGSDDYIYNNTITLSSSASTKKGLWVFNTDNATVLDNSFTINGGSSNNWGIYLYDCSGSSFTNNLIDTSSSSGSSYGIYLFDDSFDNTFTGNAINTSGASSDAIRISSAAGTAINNIFDSNAIDLVGGIDLNYINAQNDGTQLIDQTIRNYTILNSTLIVEDSTDGSITFLEPINGSGNNFSAEVQISNNFVSVDSSTIPGFNVSANVTLLGVPTGFSNPVILRDGIECNAGTTPSCYAFTSLNAGTVEFNVSGWSNYAIGEGGAAPNVTLEVNITPDPATTDDNLTANVNVTFSDTNIMVLNYTWYINGSPVQTNFTISPWVENDAVVDGLTDVGFISTPTAYYMQDNQLRLISGDNTGNFRGFYYNGTGWVENTSIVNGLPDIGDEPYPTTFYMDDELYLISGEIAGDFYGYVWNGTGWDENSTIINGLPDVGARSTPTVFENGTFYLISGENLGSFTGYQWNGTGWDSNSSIVSGLGDLGSRTRPHVFDFLDQRSLIVSRNAGDFLGYSWTGTTWTSNDTIVEGLTDVGTNSYATTFVYNQSLYLISGEQLGDFYGFNRFYNISELISDVMLSSTLTSPGDSIIVEVTAFETMQNSTEVNISIAPTIDSNPKYFNLTETPSDPATYVTGQSYEFNSTWNSSNSTIDVVTMEFDGTNYTVSGGPVYNFTIVNISAGIHNYTWYANNSLGETNQTNLLSYTINAADGNCSLVTNSPVTYPNNVTVTGTCDNTEQSLSLYRNGTNVTLENGVPTLLGVGSYLYTVNVTASQNYTASEDNATVIVNQGTPGISLSASPGFSVTNGTETNISGINCPAELTCILYRNGTPVSNPDVNTFGIGIYTYTFNTTGNANYTSNTVSANLNVSAEEVNFTFEVIETGNTFGRFGWENPDGDVTVQISVDNITFYDVNSSIFDGSIDNSNDAAIAQLLQEKTTYYVRAKDPTSSFIYDIFNTTGERDLIGIVMAFIAVILVFGIFGFFSRGVIVKVFAYGISFIELTALLFILLKEELNESLVTFLNLNFTIVLTLVFGIGMIAMVQAVLKMMDQSQNQDEEIKWSDRK